MSAIASDRITTLRQELKQWENSFAAANGGKKAGREEIKKDAAIGRTDFLSLLPAHTNHTA